MSDEQTGSQTEVDEQAADNVADIKAIIIMFGAAVLFAIHFVSGFSFDF